MKILRKLFLASTLLTISSTNFVLGMEDNESFFNNCEEAQIDKKVSSYDIQDLDGYDDCCSLEETADTVPMPPSANTSPVSPPTSQAIPNNSSISSITTAIPQPNAMTDDSEDETAAPPFFTTTHPTVGKTLSSTNASPSNQTPLYSYSQYSEVNGIFNNTIDIWRYEEWLNYQIPINFRKLINADIISAAKKYLLKNLNSSPAFFNALPIHSLTKTALCFTYYLNYRNKSNFSKPLSPLSPLSLAIEAFITNYGLDNVFDAAKHSCVQTGISKSVILSFNNILNVETVIMPSRVVKEIQISEYFLSNILDFIEHLFNVQICTLNLSCNSLSFIPLAVFSMDNLEELIMQENKIQVISKDIRYLKNLKILDLQNNNLYFLPEELLKLPNLKKIDLRKNPALYALGYPNKILIALKAKGVKVLTD